MTKHLYIFRHGQTDCNAARIWQGQSIDSPLNENGVVQAKEIVEKYGDIKLDIIYTSPLKRAKQTAEIVNGHYNLEVVVEQNLKEANFGKAEGMHKDDIYSQYPEIYHKWKDLLDESLDCKFPEGETKKEFMQRFIGTLEKIAITSNYSNIGIFAHSAIIRIMLYYFGISPQDVPNCSCYYVTYTNNKLKFEAIL